MKKTKSAFVLSSIALVLFTFESCDQPKKQEAGNAIEGVYEYLPPLKGKCVIRNGHFVFLFGSSKGGPMTGEAGTYSLSGDTVKNFITYSTDSARVGTSYNWRIKSWSGDVATYEMMNEQGEIIGGGSSTRTSR